MRKLLFALLLLIPATVRAQTTTDVLSWDLPTAYEDGTVLLASDLDAIKIYQSTVTGGPYTLVTTLPGTSLTYSISRAALGNRCYVATAVAAGIESAYSNEACKAGRKPKAPKLRVQ